MKNLTTSYTASRPAACWLLVALALAAGLLAACSAISPAVSAPPATLTKAAPPPADYFPADEWRGSTPEEQGIDSQLIADMFKKIEGEKLPVRSFLLVRNGSLVTEAYFAPVVRDDVHSQRSATKTVTSILVGIAIKEGYIKGIDQKILDFFPDITPETARQHVADLTIEHLLTMSDGHAVAISPTYNPARDKVTDWMDVFLNDRANRIVYPPGKVFMYNSGSPHVMSAVIQKATGRSLAEYAEDKLFSPLGITDYDWLADQNGITLGNSWLSLRPVDMAKLGYLYLNHGLWNGRQIVPAAWVEASTRKHMDTAEVMPYKAEQDGYGYFWWMNGFDGFSAHGSGGQFIFVAPGSNLVAVFTGAFPDPVFDTNYQLMKDYVLPAVKSDGPLPENRAANQALMDAVARAGNQPPARTVPALPEIARQISGVTYDFQDGSGMTLGFTFDDTSEFGMQLKFALDGKTHVLDARGGLDDNYRRNTNIDPVISSYPTMNVKGLWQDDHTFIVVQMPPNFMAPFMFKITFEGGQPTMEQANGDDPSAATWYGTANGKAVSE